MISELKDEEILEFLMNSELEGDYSPEELRYLLFKWRYFYRLLHGMSNRTKVDLEGKINQLEERVTAHAPEIINLQVKIADGQNIIDSMKSRKLTLKERLSGKIILKEDEPKPI